MRTDFSDRCAGCKNIPIFEDYAAGVTKREDRARLGFPLGCNVGSIACSGRVENPAMGDFCNAILTNPVVPERPEAVQRDISLATRVEDIPGYSMHA